MPSTRIGKMYSFSLRCAYPMSAFNREGHGPAFLEICGEHSHVMVFSRPSAAGRHRRILSVSNNARLLVTRNETLTVAGYSVASPKCPEDAALLLSGNDFDAVVIGDSVSQEQRARIIPVLRSIAPSIPIIFVRAESNAENEPLADIRVDVSSDPAALLVALDQQSVSSASSAND